MDTRYHEHPVINAIRILAGGEATKKGASRSLDKPPTHLAYDVRKRTGGQDSPGLPVVKLEERYVAATTNTSLQHQATHLPIHEMDLIRLAVSLLAHQPMVPCRSDRRACPCCLAVAQRPELVTARAIFCLRARHRSSDSAGARAAPAPHSGAGGR